jgi:type I restriction enzyme M protein
VDVDRLPQTAGWCARNPEQTDFHAGRDVTLRELPLNVAFCGETARTLTAEVCDPSKTGSDPLRGLFNATVSRKPAIVEYQPDTDLRDATAQMPLLNNDCIEASIRGEVLLHSPDPWINESATKIGYEVSFTRRFHKPWPLRVLDEISADILVNEREAEGLLDGLLKVGAKP